jgi:hypothetical protein
VFDDQSAPGNEFLGEFQQPPEFTSDGMTCFIACKSYFRKGGSSAEFKGIVARLIREGHLNDDVLETTAGMRESANPSLSPASSSQANGSGQSENALVRPLRSATPAREPSAADIASMERIKGQVADTIFDTFKMRDGRKIGDVRYGELLRLETTDKVEAEILKRIRERGSAAHDTPVRLLIKPKLLATIIRNAKEKYHAA